MVLIKELKQYTVVFSLVCTFIQANVSQVCDVTKEYEMISDTGKILKCPQCRECGLGFEPWPKCGTRIGVNTVIGPCRRCPKGTYSSENGVKSCQDCNMVKCFLHQLIFEGTCTDKKDSTYCVDKCAQGYKMNHDKTVCVADKEDKQNDPSIKPTHSKKANEGTGLSTWAKLAIALIGTIFFGLAIFAGFCYCKSIARARKLRMHKGRQRRLSCTFPDCSSTAIVDDRLLDEDKNPFAPLPEQCDWDKPKCEETQNGIENARPSNSEFQATDSSLSDNSHFSDMQAGSSTQPVPNPEPGNQYQMRLGELQQTIHQKICLQFNADTFGKNYEALAGWLGFTADEFKPVKLEKNPTNALLDSWGSKSENTVEKFLEILEENGMTSLVDIIREGMRSTHR